MKRYKTGIAWGCWDGLTEAHLRVLKEAKENCEFLIVGVSDDYYIKTKKNAIPVLSWEERMLIVRRLCNKVIPQSYYFTKRQAIECFNPDVIFVGEEYKNKDWEAKQFNIPIHFVKHDKKIHSDDIRAINKKT